MKKRYSIVSFSILLCNILFIAFSLPGLPEIIPLHFNVRGEIDGWGNKFTILIPAAIQGALNMLLQYLSKHPEKHNYLRQITDENRDMMYKASSDLLGKLNVTISLIFSTITYSIVHQQLSPIIILSEIAFIIIIIVHHSIMSSRK